MLFGKIIPAFALTLMVLYGSVSRAQDQQPQQPQDNDPQAPIPAVEPSDTSGGGSRQMPVPTARGLFGADSQPAGATVGGDTQSLTDAENFGVGLPNGTHNLFDAAIHLSTGGDTGIVPGETNFILSAGGIVSLNHSWNRYQLTAQYSGAEDIYSPASFENSAFQTLSIVQSILWRRTTLRLRDDISQSAAATFGGLSIGGPGLTLPGLTTAVTPTLVPNETILTGTGDRVDNLVLAEVDYALSRRSTLTFTGSYGFLHFLTNGYINTQNEDGRVGYSHQLDRKNTLGLIYDYDYISFSGGNGTVASNTVQAAYGRLLAGRTALRVSAGPQFITSNVLGFSSPNQLSWSLSANVTHQMRRTILSAAYSRGVTNGSGVLLGAETQTVTGSIATAPFHAWKPTVTGGYSSNTSLPTAVVAAGIFGYSDWFGAVNFGRLWGRTIRTNISYELQRQTQSGVSCPVLNCGPVVLLQEFSITVDWHLRPVGLE
jgi:hypothetical protein